MNKSDTYKVIVFDLDETLGHFTQLGLFLSGLQTHLGRISYPIEYVHTLLDLFPDYLRYNIVDILKQIKQHQNTDPNIKLVIYTNNGDPSWVKHIASYLAKKVGCRKLFDHIITNYSYNFSVNERTTFDKTYRDLLKCTGYSKKAHILFLDDRRHLGMEHHPHRIETMQVFPYKISIPYRQMIKRYLQSSEADTIKKGGHQQEFKDALYDFMNTRDGDINYEYNIKKHTVSTRDKKESVLILRKVNKFMSSSHTDMQTMENVCTPKVRKLCCTVNKNTNNNKKTHGKKKPGKKTGGKRSYRKTSRRKNSRRKNSRRKTSRKKTSRRKTSRMKKSHGG
jgi:hypothetical protein